MAKTIFEQMGGTYTMLGDYCLPDLILPTEEYRPIGVWGQRYLRYLKQHRKILYYNLLTSGKLRSHLTDVEEEAQELFYRLVRELAEKEGVTEEELFKAANENTKNLFPVTVRNMNEVIAEIIFDVGELDEEMSKEFEEVVNDVPDERSMYVISNASKLFGAASMLYEEPLHELSEKLGSDLYILPSSTHEVIAISSNFGEPEELAEMVYEINMDQVDINDRLSNQVYHYDKDLRTLRLATDTINKSLDDVDLGARENTERGGR